jgi:hypothetical protein
VGATQGPNFNDPVIACQSQEGGVITSGGGFSTYFPAPSWQQEAIANYFAQAAADGTTPESGYSPLVRNFLHPIIELRYGFAYISCFYCVVLCFVLCPVCRGVGIPMCPCWVQTTRQ